MRRSEARDADDRTVNWLERPDSSHADSAYEGGDDRED